MTNPHMSVQELDAELSRRLEATLDASTKFELEAVRVFETLQTTSEEQSPTTPPQERATSAEEQDYPTGLAGDTPPDEATQADRPQAEMLARVLFEDGDAFHFLAIPADGEIGLAYTGRNLRRWAAATSELVSPLRLYVSIAPPEAPVPWLLAAVDKQKDRLELVGSRRLDERVDEPLEAQSGPRGTLQLRVPALPGGVWIPDNYTIGGYCGWNGEAEWWLDWCWALGGSGLGPSFEQNIFRCTSEISTEVTHKSIQDGAWRRRKCATAQAVACASPVRIRHQYRKLKLFQWKWVTCNDDVLGPMQVAQGTLWLGLVRRRRQIVYERQGGIGGFRAWSMFSRNLSGGHDAEWAVAWASGLGRWRRAGPARSPGPSFYPYSPSCLVGDFCELHLYRVLGGLSIAHLRWFSQCLPETTPLVRRRRARSRSRCCERREGGPNAP